MYVANTYLATTAAAMRAPYDCKHCQRGALADVAVVGQGYAEAPFFIGQKAAAAHAEEAATAALPNALNRALGLAGCPHCGACDPDQVKKAKVDASLQGLATWPGVLGTVMALMVGIAGLAAAQLTTKLALFGAAALCAAIPMGIMASLRYRQMRREADLQVTWLPATSELILATGNP